MIFRLNLHTSRIAIKVQTKQSPISNKLSIEYSLLDKLFTVLNHFLRLSLHRYMYYLFTRFIPVSYCANPYPHRNSTHTIHISFYYHWTGFFGKSSIKSTVNSIGNDNTNHATAIVILSNNVLRQLDTNLAYSFM